MESSISASISAPANPASAKISRVCCPSRGARRPVGGTVSDHVLGSRMVRIATDNLTIYGTIDFEAIGQNTDPRSRFGEGLASAFDIGAI